MVNNIAYLKTVYKQGDYNVPRIHVENLTRAIGRKSSGYAGVVAVIGAFPNNDSEVRSFSSYDKILNYYGVDEGTETEKLFNGLLACKQILRTRNHSSQEGASAVIVANITQFTDEMNELLDLTANAQIMDDQGKIYKELSNYQLKDENGNTVKLVFPSAQDTPNTSTSEENVTTFDVSTAYDTTFTADKLNRALNRLYTENFDLIFTADDFSSTYVTTEETQAVVETGSTEGTGEGEDEDEPTTSTTTTVVSKEVKYLSPFEAAKLIKDFLADEFRLQRPAQYIAPFRTEDRDTSADNTATLNIMERINEQEIESMSSLFEEDVFGCGGFYTQRLFIDFQKEPLSLLESASYMTGFLASLRVEAPLTYRTIPGVTGVYDEATVGPQDTGYFLTNMGFPVIVCKLRDSVAQIADYCVLNSTLPCGFDIAQVRAVTYLIKQYNLQQFLGLPNNESTRAQIGAEITVINKKVMEDVNIIQEIVASSPYIPERDGKLCPKEVYIDLNVIVNGVIIVINLGVNMEEYQGQVVEEEY